jgi:hypothetical protein
MVKEVERSAVSAGSVTGLWFSGQRKAGQLKSGWQEIGQLKNRVAEKQPAGRSKKMIKSRKI